MLAQNKWRAAGQQRKLAKNAHDPLLPGCCFACTCPAASSCPPAPDCSYQGLQHAGLPAALAADDSHLRQAELKVHRDLRAPCHAGAGGNAEV